MFTINRLLKSIVVGLILMLHSGCSNGDDRYKIDGEMRTWHTLTFSFRGPWVSEKSYPNPFLNYRLYVTFENDGESFQVPGFFAADGDAAESGTGQGDTWQVRFKPNKPGEWSFKVSFREGKNLAVDDHPGSGTPIACDGLTGRFFIENSNKKGRDFRAHGRLEYIGERYLSFAGKGGYFIKGGADSPENLLAYKDFDGTYYGGSNKSRMGEDNPNADLHGYEPHIRDWNPGDPTWQGEKGKGIIGTMNYLASKGMNSVYFLTMNVLGDGEDVWPWTEREERYRFDCSKLDQWEIVFDHMEKQGIMMHLVLQETENECLLDAGRMDVQRKLYLRELIARFAHHLAITWNIGEENGPAHWTPVGQTIEDRMEMMSYIRKINPYNSFIVTHTHAADPDHTRLIEPFLGFISMEGPSLQLSPPALVHEYTKKWIFLSERASRPWVVCSDELGPHWMGVMPDAIDPDHDTIRSEALWGNLMAGGAGVEWYFGYKYEHSDLNCEDWRSRDLMWDQTRIALDFFQNFIPFSKMENHDELVDNGYCLASQGEVYAIYCKNGLGGILKLPDHPGNYTLSWYNPRTGEDHPTKEMILEEASGKIEFGPSPADTDKDWVCLIKRVEN